MKDKKDIKKKEKKVKLSKAFKELEGLSTKLLSNGRVLVNAVGYNRVQNAEEVWN